jgi:hypothetical protein
MPPVQERGMTDDLPFDYPSPANPGAPAPRKCRRHQWEWTQDIDGDGQSRVLSTFEWCARCHRVKDDTTARRGKNNRSRGNSIERWVCKLLGISRRGQYGGPDDGGDSDDWIVVQVKSGTAYPERIDSLLRALPERAGQLRGVVHVDTPGPGVKRRALITLDLYAFAEWYGKGDAK